MKSRICVMAVLFLLISSLFLPLSTAKAVAETRVTITIAGGLACGLFFFLQYGFRSSLLQPNPDDSTALLNRGPAGWEIAFPSVEVRPDEGGKMAYPDRSGETVQMELLKLRF
ncbi:MAG: hypothetical protein LLG97_17320 [Deltaproteobacteria bacterium]|nr:hypothetical protein [Deltaproteobacteria bacterium]